jgi:hypothetical protein
MPDIDLCTNKECPLRGDCYRARAVPSQRQWVTRYEPRLESNGKIEELICDYFIPIAVGMRIIEAGGIPDSVPGDE